MDHPHPDKNHLIRVYRRYILGIKKKIGTARGLFHYSSIIATYRKAKSLI